MTSYDACTSGASQVLTVASLQRLKMEALILAPADCEVLSVINFLNAQSISPIEIHSQLCQVYGHTWLNGQHISCRSSAGRCIIIIHPIARTLGPVNSIFSYTSRNSCLVSINVFSMTERRRLVSHCGSNPRRQTSTAQRYKSWSHGMTNVLIPEVNVLKIAQHLLCLLQ